ncbi:MAG: pyridoxamine 5'-phosphate oxidase family protein [Candidatus Rokubacteria bacterium]|nr:pyridoxamine 5'-phosphate oxidase family protein [Candidatus Rokubacteria bacterium]
MKFKDPITTLEELRALMGEPSEMARKKQIDRLDVHCREYIAHAPFVLVGTADAAGRCDVSPKGDAPGFVRVLDDRHLVIPDRPGNKRLDSIRNILENPHIGLIFLVPRYEETLRINGRATITRDPELLASMPVGGKVPKLAIGVEVEEVFMHCAKAFRRSSLWQPEQWPDISDMKPAACMLFDHAKPEGMTVEDIAKRLDLGYRTTLY